MVSLTHELDRSTRNQILSKYLGLLLFRLFVVDPPMSVLHITYSYAVVAG